MFTKSVLFFFVVEAGKAVKTTTSQNIYNDLEAARGLLLQMQEHFNNLEGEVSKLSKVGHDIP